MSRLYCPVRGNYSPTTVISRTNLGEATPAVLSPLCWSVWDDGGELAWRKTMFDLGVRPKKDLPLPPDPEERATVSVYGRTGMNIDAMRPMLDRIPGMSADDWERDTLGYVREGLPVTKGAPQRMPIVAGKSAVTLLAARRRVRRQYEDVREWWLTQILSPDTESTDLGTNYALLKTASDQFAAGMYRHAIVRFQIQAAHAAIAKLAATAGDPTLASRVMSGIGGVAETQLANDAWRLANNELSEAEFLRDHGFHGPNEGNVYTKSWREEPARIRAIAEAISRRGGAPRPEELERRASAEAQAAVAEFKSKLNRRSDRMNLDFMLKRGVSLTRTLELGKAAYLMGIDGCRAAARRLGKTAVAQGLVDEVDDVFFLTIPEIGALIDGDLLDARDIIKYRRGQREIYERLSLPTVFSGMPEIEKYLDVQAGATDGPFELAGVASGGGTVTGRARVVTDPNEDVELEPGDILVCRFTDPSWAPLFTCASALVIDLGGAVSHGAVVARELGIPYVIGTDDGTYRIPEGALIEVDGGQNTVRSISEEN